MNKHYTTFAQLLIKHNLSTTVVVSNNMLNLGVSFFTITSKKQVMKAKLVTLLLVSCLFTLAVQAQNSPYSEEPYNPVDSVGFVATTQGKIVVIANHFMIVPNDKSTRYYPKNLDDAFKVEGMEVSFTAIRLRVPPNVRMMGMPIYLKTITANAPNKTAPSTGRKVKALPNSKPSKATVPTGSKQRGNNAVNKNPKLMNVKGTIVEAAGYHVIETSEGLRYFDANLASQYKVAGTKVVFTGTPGTIPPNVRMVGRPIEIHNIRIDKAQGKGRRTTQDPDWIRKFSD